MLLGKQMKYIVNARFADKFSMNILRLQIHSLKTFSNYVD